MKKQPLYLITFKDGTRYVGGTDYNHTLWLDIPNKEIKTLFYKLPNDQYFELSDYDEFFHMVEATQDWMRIGPRGNEKITAKPKIEYAYIMGKREDTVNSYRIMLYDNHDGISHIGDISVKQFNVNDPFIKKLNPQSWK